MFFFTALPHQTRSWTGLVGRSWPSGTWTKGAAQRAYDSPSPQKPKGGERQGWGGGGGTGAHMAVQLCPTLRPSRAGRQPAVPCGWPPIPRRHQKRNPRELSKKDGGSRPHAPTASERGPSTPPTSSKSRLFFSRMTYIFTCFACQAQAQTYFFQMPHCPPPLPCAVGCRPIADTLPQGVGFGSRPRPTQPTFR